MQFFFPVFTDRSILIKFNYKAESNYKMLKEKEKNFFFRVIDSISCDFLIKAEEYNGV